MKIETDTSLLNENKMKNFFAFTYSCAAISFGISAIFGFFASLYIPSSMLLILQLISIPISYYFMQKLQNSDFLLETSTSKILSIFFIKSILNGFFLSFAFFVAFSHAVLVYQALIITVLVFLISGIYVFFSKKDFSFSNNFKFLQIFGLFFVLVTLGLLLQIIVYYISPALYDKIDNVLLFFCLILNIISVVYVNGIIKKIYENFSYNHLTLSKLGVFASLILVNTFISLFINIIRILLKFSNNKK